MQIHRLWLFHILVMLIEQHLGLHDAELIDPNSYADLTSSFSFVVYIRLLYPTNLARNTPCYIA